MSTILLPYLICLLPRLVVILWMGWVKGQSIVFLYETRTIPFWDPFPVLLYDLASSFPVGTPQLLGIAYALAAALLGPVVYRLGTSLDLSPRASMLAVVGVSAYPYYVSTGWYQPEGGITITLTALCALGFARIARETTISSVVFCSAAASLLLLDRADAVAFVGFLGGLAYVTLGRRNRSRQPLLHVGVIVLAAALSTASVEYLTVGRFSALPAKSGYNLLLGHNAAVNRYLREDHSTTMELAVLDTAFAPFGPDVRATLQDPEHSDLFTRQALTFIREHPRLTLANIWHKFRRYWDWRLEDAEAQSRLKNLTYGVSYLSLVALAALGVVSLLLRRAYYPLWFTLGGVFAGSLPGLMTIPIIRIRMYSEFLLILLAAAGISAMVARIRGPNAELRERSEQTRTPPPQ